MARTCFVVTSAALLIGASFANAASITFTESAIATGSLGSNSFSSSLITLTATGYTSNVVNKGGGVFDLPVAAVVVYIASLNLTANLTDAEDVFVCQVCSAVGAVGITDNPSGDILDSVNGAFSTYNLTTSIGPITDPTGDGAVDPRTFFATNQGLLQIASDSTSTFTATVGAATREPATTALFGLALGGLVTLKRWNKRHAFFG